MRINISGFVQRRFTWSCTSQEPNYVIEWGPTVHDMNNGGTRSFWSFPFEYNNLSNVSLSHTKP